MSTATIKPKTGTAKQWTDSGRILEVNEWGVSVTEAGQYILKIGDGINKFDDLPAAVSTPYFEEIQENITKKYNEVAQFKDNIGSATSAANTAANAAQTATAAANAAAKACNAIVVGQNTMTDETTNVTYRLGVAGGKIYIEQID